MQSPQPYLFTSPRVVAPVDRPQMVPAEGPLADPIYGYHTIWAAEIPFIPAHTGKDDRDFDTETTNRISRTIQRQVRFLYDLAQSRDHLSTFELRFVSWPTSGGTASVGIVFFAKTFHPNERMSRQLALELWNKFWAVFPREVPFSYPLIPICEPSRASSLQTHTFEQWYEPISFNSLTNFASIVELRKYEDWPTLRNVGGVYHAHDYIPHPFVPALDYSAMARLFETMAHQDTVCIVAITLRPQRLTDQEELMLHEHARWFERVASGEDDQQNALAEAMHNLKNYVFDAYPRAHAEQGMQVYNVLRRECHSLFNVRLQVIGEAGAQAELIEALGSEIMANAGNAYPSRWSRVEAHDAHEFQSALYNWQWLEFARWGISPLVQQAPALVRLRQFATVLEVSGAFRLPVATGSGRLAGLDVRDEPFFLPAPSANRHHADAHLICGNILDRGVPTGAKCLLPMKAFSGFTQIFGETGGARERVLFEVLQAIGDASIPWILLGGNGVTHPCLAQQTGIRHVLIDSSPPVLEFHPLLPPPGLILSRFLNVLVRVFTGLFELDDASASVLRRAFLQAYERAGWTERDTGQPISLATLATEIEAVSRQTDVPEAIANLLCTHCVLPLRDIALTVPQLSTAPYTHINPWSTRTVIEFGWPGSDIGSNLLRGSLWAWLALALTSASTTPHTLRGLIALEDAHTLFHADVHRHDAASPSPLATFASTIVRSGIGILFIDDRPDAIDTTMIANAHMRIITANSYTAAQEYAAELIGASPRQRTRMRHLASTEAVVAISGSHPILIKM